MLNRVPNLPWPQNLFNLPHLMVATETTSPLYGGGKKLLGAHICACGCKQPHNMAVSGLEGGHGFRRVNWYKTLACKNKHLGISP
jgi:hypothetical protein